MRYSTFSSSSRLVAAMFVAWLLASCGPRGIVHVDKGTEFNDSEDAGIVVIGQSVDDMNEGSLSSYWESTRKFAGPEKMKSVIVWSHPKNKYHDQFKYNVIKLTPGDYFLSSTTIEEYDRQIHKYQNTWYLEGIPKNFAAVKTPKFSITKGEIIYIGDIVFDKPFPARIKRIERNDDEARSALAGRVITDPGRMIFRPAMTP